MLNGDIVDALSMIVPEERAYLKGRGITEKLKEIIPRQMFEIPIQAAIGAKDNCKRNCKSNEKRCFS